MKIIHEYTGANDAIEEFADKLKLVLFVEGNGFTYSAHFVGAVVKTREGYCANQGSGNTAQEAIEAYAENISGKTIYMVAHIGDPNQSDQRFEVPNLVMPKATKLSVVIRAEKVKNPILESTTAYNMGLEKAAVIAESYEQD